MQLPRATGCSRSFAANMRVLYERKRLVTVDVTEVVAREDIALARAGDGELLDLRQGDPAAPG